MKKNTILLGFAAWAMLLVVLLSAAATLLASGRSEMPTRYGRLEAIRKTIVDHYYQEVDEDLLMEGAIRGMTNVLQDPYTFYYTPDEMQQHTQETEGEYHGVGMLVQNNDQGIIEVIRVYENSPAERGGACVGDCILAVDGINVYGTDSQALNDAVNMIQGEDGTEVIITVRRNDEILDLPLIRSDVRVSNVTSAMLENGIGYIGLAQFSGDAVEGFENALAGLDSVSLQGLVIDLRNNPGGILDDVVAIADRLLPEGIIVYTEDRAGNRIDYRSDAECEDMPLVVLINGMSASASEILAASLQDFDCATVIGTRSYGKGIVQTLVQFEEDGAGLQYTSATYFTPSGTCIHGYGVTPDIIVEAEEGFASYAGMPDPENDVQLQAAIAQLKK